ncbi:hypothetical protein NADE_000066 [Nannochloris sp. 'desiccata']|nr:hypothetical protein KSW81_005140 [Chlorella desiccata (nom. nud.)]KAH7617862.1 hypothetical protein NADE_000066 [Chlorella desiccata (nom. nud.)]
MACFCSAPVLCSRIHLTYTRTSSSRSQITPCVHQLSYKQQKRSSNKSIIVPAGVGDDAVSSWLDLAGFVAKTKGSRSPYEELSSKIGDQCYIDVQGWHLYLKDVKIAPGAAATVADALAEKLGSTIQGQGFSQSMLDSLMSQVPVKLGQGKSTLPLADVMPSSGVQDLAEICEKYARDM